MRARWEVDAVHRIVSRLSPERLRGLLAIEDRAITGAGVDVATGQVIFSEEDARLPGPPPISLARTYASGWAHRAGVLGRGWSLSIEQHVAREPSGLVWRDGEGRELVFALDGDAPARGEGRGGRPLAHPVDPATLRVLGPGTYRIDRGDARLTFEAPGGRGARAPLCSLEIGADHARIRHDEAGRPVVLEVGALRLELLYAQTRLELARLVLSGGEALELARYDYDARGDLSCVRAGGVEHRYAYASGLLVVRRGGDGGAAYFGYDDTGSGAKCIRTWRDGGYDDRKLRYRRGSTTVVDGVGARRAFEHDLLNRALARPDGRAGYDPATLAALRFEGEGVRRSARLLDDAGRPVELETEAGVFRYAYDERDRVVRREDPGGGQLELRYGERGGVVERVEAGQRRLVRRNERGAEEIVVGDEWLEVERDGGRRVARVTLRDEVWRAEYDPLGRARLLSGPEGERRFEHDPRGRLRRMEVDGVGAGFEWDGEGRLLRARMPEGDWVIERDAGGLPRLVTRPDLAYELVFDRERRLTEIRDRRGRSWRFVRGRGGRVREEVDFDERVHRYAYEGSTLRVGRVELPGGETLRLSRDGAGRLARARWGMELTEAFAYDPAGRLIAARRGEAEVGLSRDVRGAVVGERQGDDEIGAARDARGRRNLLVSSLGARITRAWGPRGERLLEVVAPDGARHEVRLEGEHLRAGGLRIRRAADRPPVRAAGQGEVRRDALGRVVGWAAPDGRAFGYAYGADGLLRDVAMPTGETLRYAYDAFGRRTSARSESWDARWIWDGGVAMHELTSYAPPTLYVFDPGDGAPIGKVRPGAARWLGLFEDFVCLFDPAARDRPTTEYWPWRGGLEIDFPTGLWLGPGRAFHPRAAEPMGTGTLEDELLGPTERRAFDYLPRAAEVAARASDAHLARFVRRLTTPSWLEQPRVPPAPWPEPIEPPRVVPRGPAG